MRIATCYSIAAVAILGCAGSRIVNTIPPANQTATRLAATKGRVEQYWQTHKRVPESIDQLPDAPHKNNSIQDGWGRPLIWESDGVRTVRISSLGQDGVKGGTGDNADSEVIFEGS